MKLISQLITTLLLLLSTQYASAQILVAVEDGSTSGSGADVVAQLNDDTFFDFQATLVTQADIDTVGELMSYDVVVFGGSGNNNADWTAAMWTAVRAWVEAGGGAVLTGWGNFDARTGDPGDTDIEFIFPGQNLPSVDEFVSGTNTINFLSLAHPITTGLTNFAPGAAFIEVNRFAAEPNDTILANIVGATGDISVAYKDSLGTSGRSVYLGPVYFGSAGYNTPPLRSGDPDQLLEQAVTWAGGGSARMGPAIPVPMLSTSTIIMLILLFSLLAVVRLRIA